MLILQPEIQTNGVHQATLLLILWILMVSQVRLVFGTNLANFLTWFVLTLDTN